ncbi:MAG: hypothetical protein NTZ34_11765 [Chloroflexi bacterium]|nr:hypothetical protein [Chloroflexota bacterium]
MVAVLIWAWKYSGLTDVQAQIVSVVGGLMGVNFDWVKTIGKKYETATVTAAASPSLATAAAVTSKISTEPTSTYNTPLDADAYIKSLGASLNDQYDECKSIISNYNLLSIHPSVRVTVAEQVMDKTIDLAKAVWPSVVGTGPNGAPFYRAPEAADYKDYASKQSFDKAVRDAIPGYQYMPEGANVLFHDMEEYYTYRANLTLLEGKSIGWYEADGKTARIRAIYTLAVMGLSAVA